MSLKVVQSILLKRGYIFIPYVDNIHYKLAHLNYSTQFNLNKLLAHIHTNINVDLIWRFVEYNMYKHI